MDAHEAITDVHCRIGSSENSTSACSSAHVVHCRIGSSETPQAEVVLAVPCASIVGGALVLHVANPDGTLVMTTGLPRWGLWVNGAGAIVAEGSVTDEANGGDFWVAGGTTPLGETSPLLQAGGLVVLGTTSLT